ncbi:nucleotide-binding alpha-beta plait domain-containing protein [Tanacetum coccineum]
MGTYRSKEDDVAKISTTVYVTNFPESLSAKELFNSCKVYGHVVDSFIPTKRAKNGKRFGFVRFINVFSEERLVNNLCTVWIERYKLHANISRFYKNNVTGTKEDAKGDGGSMNNDGQTEDEDVEKPPAIVLDDNGLIEINIGKGEKIEGIPFKLWSGNTFNRIAAKWGDLLDVDDQEDTYFHSKHFTEESDDEDQYDTNSNDDGSKDQVPGFFGRDSDVEGVQENMCNEVGKGDNNLEEGELNKKVEKLEDPFNIYPILNKKVEKGGYDNKSESSLKYPPGFSPIENNVENSLHGGGDSNYDGEGSTKSN